MAAGPIGSFATRARRRLARARRTVALSVLERGRFRLDLERGAPDPDSVPIVMAHWARPERASETLRELARQVDAPPLRLIWWNNRRRDDRAYRAAIADAADLGSMSSVELRSSRVNLGGLARFLVLRRLRRDGYVGPVILLDDDQRVGPTFVAELLARYTPRSVRGVWAFRQHGSYWGRSELADSDDASYVGTGGCIIDATIVDDREFFAALPDRYRFIEDQWLSFVARVHGWTLAKADIPVEFVLQERNQYLAMIDVKEDFFTYLYNLRPDLRPE